MKINHDGVQYGTIQAIWEAQNNWGVLALCGEATAMVLADGLFPSYVGNRPKKPYSSVDYYENMHSLRNSADVFDDTAVFTFKGDKGNNTPDMLIIGKMKAQGKHLDLEVDILPMEVMNGTITLEQSYVKYKNKIGIDNYRKFIENWAKDKGYNSIRYFNIRSTGPATGRIQSSKKYGL